MSSGDIRCSELAAHDREGAGRVAQRGLVDDGPQPGRGPILVRMSWRRIRSSSCRSCWPGGSVPAVAIAARA